VAAASTAQDAQQTGRIARLSALYRSGQYSIDSAQVSQAMVSQALGGGAGEND
jgi:anti-sigma28 factor (negative regulator of flagellin synthesis)